MIAIAHPRGVALYDSSTDTFPIAVLTIEEVGYFISSLHDALAEACADTVRPVHRDYAQRAFR